MAYTGTDLNKAEKGYVDEQDQALQDQIDLADFVTELDANDFDAESYFKVEDDGSGTNNVFVPKTIAEMKADLGLPTGVYKCRFQITTDDEGSVFLAKSVPVKNTESGFTTTFTRLTTGSYTITLPVDVTYKRLANVFFESNGNPTYTIRSLVTSGALANIYLYNNAGSLADPALDTVIYFYLDLEWY